MKFRLKLKRAYERLVREDDKEEFFEQTKSLNAIDPFKHGIIYVIAIATMLFFGWYKIVILVNIVFLIWVFLYFVTFWGVLIMWRQKSKK